METLHRLHIADPAEFYALPEAWQALHLQHTVHHLQGRYEVPRDRHGRPVPAQQAPPAQLAAHVRQWHEQRQQPPSPQEVACAQTWLATPGLPAPLREAAQQTLERAGEAA